MSCVYLCSDPHLGHRNISKFRTIFTSTEMNDEIITDSICSVVTKRDILIIVGDVVFTEEAYDTYFTRILATGAHIIVVLGNHDGENGQRKKLLKRMVADGVELQGMMKYKGFWITHAPMHPTELRGKKNIHGHMHKEQIKLEDGSLDTRYINVSMEHTNYGVVKFQDIAAQHRQKFIRGSRK